MTNIAYRILKLEPIIKKARVTNYAFFVVVAFSRIKSFAYTNSIVIQDLIL